MVEKLNIDLLEKLSKEKYNKERIEYIADYEVAKVGWFGVTYDPAPLAGEAHWNKNFPEGYDDWVNKRGEQLTVWGMQELLNKVDELVDVVNNYLVKSTVEKL